MQNFSETFLKRVGRRLDHSLSEDERAVEWVRCLPPVLTCDEIAKLMIRGERLPAAADPDVVERDIKFALLDACNRGILKARIFEQKRRDKYEVDSNVPMVHRDDARRYFAGINLTPPDSSLLVLWLKGAEAGGKPETASAQDKADFQQMCMEQWERNPPQTITGENGVVQEVGKSYLRLYALSTLEKWAREVAPDGVKGVRGRRKKSSPE